MVLGSEGLCFVPPALLKAATSRSTRCGKVLGDDNPVGELRRGAEGDGKSRGYAQGVLHLRRVLGGEEMGCGGSLRRSGLLGEFALRTPCVEQSSRFFAVPLSAAGLNHGSRIDRTLGEWCKTKRWSRIEALAGAVKRGRDQAHCAVMASTAREYLRNVICVSVNYR